MKTLLQLFALTVCLATHVRADISILLINPNQIGTPGETLQFVGDVTNTGATTVFLNADNINFPGVPSLTTTDLFLMNVPVSLAAGQSSGDIELFDVSLSDPFTDPPVLYSGSYTLSGGVDANAQIILDSAEFSVKAAPEPGFYGLLALCLGGMLFAMRRRRLRP
jgi:hypothetical protein